MAQQLLEEENTRSGKSWLSSYWRKNTLQNNQTLETNQPTMYFYVVGISTEDKHKRHADREISGSSRLH